MPQTKLQRALYALLTVIITVHAYVFYSLYVINGDTFLANAQAIAPGIDRVLPAINALGGVPMLGRSMPIWAVVLIEFCLAYLLEMLVGQPSSFKLACKSFDPAKTHPVLFETAVISATVGIMCPAMGFLAALLYYPYQYSVFNVFTLLANWMKLVCFNFPFAWFTQVFFIQPMVRTIFKHLIVRETHGRARAAG